MRVARSPRLIPSENEQPEALAFLNEDDWTVPENGEKPTIEVGNLLEVLSDPALRRVFVDNNRDLIEKLRPFFVPPPSQAESDTIVDEIESAMEREKQVSEEHHPTGYYLGLEAALEIVTRKTKP